MASKWTLMAMMAKLGFRKPSLGSQNWCGAPGVGFRIPSLGSQNWCCALKGLYRGKQIADCLFLFVLFLLFWGFYCFLLAQNGELRIGDINQYLFVDL